MKKGLILLALVLSCFIVNAQNFKGLDASPMDAVSYPMSYKTSDKIIKIIYSRPQLKGRKVASLAKPGEVWRVGANEATEIRLYKDIIFGGKKVEAGLYSLFAIPGEKEWTIILNSDTDVWGSYSYNEEHDVVRVKGEVSESEMQIEAFTIAFDNKMNLYLAWGNEIVTVPMSEE
ncbi:DUF2911 domain-containing protein [Wenyingzhuangia marina]|uniref:DUF2911 domain-containing protein n=1 Tax=Wenyingzhuangia marina TaxID=1195760 RepID=A0A1M5S920_9FLAO|nr:DUF2911 domain-containing protein [Wenyingzhuangia marina]GGF61311.1 hypothetical protein GCM10011397_00480 [Wenyingzhuangia marina]SHH34940.1 Protein of unknown function [Wenyingzhuangia marina]